MHLLDNVSIGILTKLNELSERHGISPCDFVATVRDDDKRGTILCVESPAANTPDMEARFNRMLAELPLNNDDEIVGDKAIFAALDQALARAPKPRIR